MDRRIKRACPRCDERDHLHAGGMDGVFREVCWAWARWAPESARWTRRYWPSSATSIRRGGDRCWRRSRERARSQCATMRPATQIASRLYKLRVLMKLNQTKFHVF